MRQNIPGTRHRQARRRLLDAARFEILPIAGVADRVAQLPAGAKVTVTASPRYGVEATVQLTEQLARDGFDAVPHLAARQLTDEVQLDGILDRLQSAGVRDLFVVGGDSTSLEGAFPDGLALLKAIDASGYRFEQVGVPAYPEGHPSIDDHTLQAALAAKQDYATYAVTQMCFDADTIVGFAAAARARGVTLPIVAGIPGAVAMAKLLRVGFRIGVGDSLRFVRGNRSVARRLLSPRGYRPDGLLRRLSALDETELVTGLHIYTFNEIAPTVRWLDQRRRQQFEREEVAADDYAV